MLFAEDDAEGAALAGDTVFEVEAASVVLVYDTSGQRQAETPTTALGGETYFRYIAGGQMKHHNPANNPFFAHNKQRLLENGMANR